MTERERLIAIMQEWGTENTDSFPFESVSDYLLANGVIVPPCKVGDKVYSLMQTSCEDIDGVHTVCEYYDTGIEDLCALPFGRCPYEYRIEECVVTDFNLLLFTARWNETVFLTREEAEKALAERSRG